MTRGWLCFQENRK